MHLSTGYTPPRKSQPKPEVNLVHQIAILSSSLPIRAIGTQSASQPPHARMITGGDPHLTDVGLAHPAITHKDHRDLIHL